MSRVAIICNNILTRMGLKNITDERNWDSESFDFTTLLSTAKESADKYDLIIVSVGKSHDLANVVTSICRVYADTPTVLVLEDDDLVMSLGMLPNSFRALISPLYQSDQIGAVLDLVLSGAYVFPKEFFGSGRDMYPADKEVLLSSTTSLTKREMEILQMLSRGMPNKEIGRALKISSNTVDSHVSSIIKKLNVRNRTEAAVYANAVEPSAVDSA